MLECLLIKVHITDPFDIDRKFCEYYQVLKEEFYSISSNSMEYKYILFRPIFKKRLSKYIANTILLSYTSALLLDLDSSDRRPYIAKNDDEYLNKYFCFGYATIVYKYTI